MNIVDTVTSLIYVLFDKAIFVLLVLMGSLLIWQAHTSAARAREQQSWPQTKGKIISTEILEGTITDSNTKEATTYAPKINYEYSVGGKRYMSSVYTLDPHWVLEFREQAETIVKDYPIGREVPIFYDPQRPEVAILIQSDPKINPFTLWIGIGLVAAGLFGLFFKFLVRLVV